MFKVTINTKDVERKLRDISERQIPYALKEGGNSFAKDAIKREQKEMQRIFDRPTKVVLYGLRVKKWATKQDPAAELAFKDTKARFGAAVERALKPHIPGYPNTREPKGMEDWLRHIGFMRADEWLVPSRTFPLDRHGNVPGHLAQKMLADIGAQPKRAGFGFETTTKGRKAQFIFGEVHGRNGRPVKGIWKVQGGRDNFAKGRWSLMMIVVTKRPTYAKRFDFYGVAQEHAEKHLAEHVAAGIDKAIRTAR